MRMDLFHLASLLLQIPFFQILTHILEGRPPPNNRNICSNKCQLRNRSGIGKLGLTNTHTCASEGMRTCLKLPLVEWCRNLQSGRSQNAPNNLFCFRILTKRGRETCNWSGSFDIEPSFGPIAFPFRCLLLLFLVRCHKWQGLQGIYFGFLNTYLWFP